MLIKSGSWAQESSGKIGAWVASRNRGGAYARANAVPINPKTNPQVAARQRLSEMVADWTSSLSEIERGAWNAYAETAPVTNRLGDQILLSGQNWFVRLNTPRLQAGVSKIFAPPSTIESAIEPILLDVTADNPGVDGAIKLSFDATQAWATNPEAVMLVRFGAQVNASQSRYYRNFINIASLKGVSPGGIISPQDLTIPVPTNVGSRIFIDARVSLSDGRLSSIVQFNTILATTPP